MTSMQSVLLYQFHYYTNIKEYAAMHYFIFVILSHRVLFYYIKLFISRRLFKRMYIFHIVNCTTCVQQGLITKLFGSSQQKPYKCMYCILDYTQTHTYYNIKIYHSISAHTNTRRELNRYRTIIRVCLVVLAVGLQKTRYTYYIDRDIHIQSNALLTSAKQNHMLLMLQEQL